MIANQNELNVFAQEVVESILEIEDSTYRDIMGNAIERLDLIRSLKESPYGLKPPMNYSGGLLVHVIHSIRFAKVAIEQAQDVEIDINGSLIIAGCVLRNIGWHTTTKFVDGELRARDAYYMTGIRRASARYIDHLMLCCENDLQIAIPEEKKQALENMCNKREDIKTLEGKIVSCADNMADVLNFYQPGKRRGNWNNGIFVGHK